jgi:periplasmic protein TonB
MLAKSVPASIAVHVAALLIVFVLPLAAPVVLSVPGSPLPPFIKAAAIPPPPAPPPRAPANRVPPSATATAAPTLAPPAIVPEIERPTAASALTDPFGVTGPPIDTGGIGILTNPIEPPRPPPTPHRSGPVRAGELLVAPRKLVDVRPVYPEIARSAHIEGTVMLEAVLDRRGRVSQVRVTKSSPLLDQAAIDAVRQWQYSPSVLHGQPVEVLMTVTITFTLRQG